MTTGSGYIYKTLPNDLRMKMKCQVLARFQGERFFRLLGDTTSVAGNRTIEETDVYSNETPDKDLALTDQTRNELALTIVLRQATEFAKKVMFQSSVESAVQPAVEDHVINILDIDVDDILPLDHVAVTDIAVVASGAGAAAYLEGTHFKLDREMGRLQLLAHPAGTVGPNDLKITYSAASVTTKTYGPMSNTDQRAEVIIRQNNKWGPSFDFEFSPGQIRPDGDMGMGQDGDDFGELTLIYRIYADTTKPPQYRLGRVREIPKAA